MLILTLLLPGKADPKWFIDTRKLLAEHAKEALDASDDLLARSLAKCVRSELHYAVEKDWTTEMDQQLAAIFKRAQEFYRLLYSQPSQFQVKLAKAKVDGKARPFRPEEMEIVNGGMDDEATVEGSAIEISVFPAVFKVVGASVSDSPADLHLLLSLTSRFRMTSWQWCLRARSLYNPS